MSSKKDVWEHILEKDHCFIIAEAASNHNGSLETAKQLVDVAVKAKADAVKFQFFKAKTISANSNVGASKLPDGSTLRELYETCEAPYDWIPGLADYCNKQNILFCASPFDRESTDLLDKAGVKLFKIASFELIDIPFLKYIARKKKPMIISTGGADMQEIQEAVGAIQEEDNKQIILLHCGINYPVSLADVNLRAMDIMRKTFRLPIGYSDHTEGTMVPWAAVARGAQVVEKHFTLSRKSKGPDHHFAIEPGELKEMVRLIRMCEQTLGKAEKKPTPLEIPKRAYRRSIFAAKDIKKDEILTGACFDILRPADGLKPKYIYQLIEKKALKDLKKNSPVDWDLVNK